MNQHAQHPHRLLDVRLVEGVYAAAVAGKREMVLSAVSAAEEATLPGLVEYLCLRHARGEELGLPPVPERIAQSDLGRSLQRVVCPFGLRTSGGFTPNTGVNPLPSEFFVLWGEQDYSTRAYKLFETRWARACESLGFRERRAALHLALSAMVENAILHADSPDGVLVGSRLLADAALFTVADLGRGVLASLRTNDDYRHLEHHRDALRLAFRDGVRPENCEVTLVYMQHTFLLRLYERVRDREDDFRRRGPFLAEALAKLLSTPGADGYVLLTPAEADQLAADVLARDEVHPSVDEASLLKELEKQS